MQVELGNAPTHSYQNISRPHDRHPRQFWKNGAKRPVVQHGTDEVLLLASKVSTLHSSNVKWVRQHRERQNRVAGPKPRQHPPPVLRALHRRLYDAVFRRESKAAPAPVKTDPDPDPPSLLNALAPPKRAPRADSAVSGPTPARRAPKVTPAPAADGPLLTLRNVANDIYGILRGSRASTTLDAHQILVADGRGRTLGVTLLLSAIVVLALHALISPFSRKRRRAT